MKNIVYNCDCMEFMKTVSDKYYELAIPDPPYGIGAGVQKQGFSKIKGRKNSIVKRCTLKSKEWDNKIPHKNQ